MNRYPNTNVIAAVSLACILALVVFLVPASDPPQRTMPVSLAVLPAEPTPPAPETAVKLPEVVWDSIKIRRGDSMARIFSNQGLPASDLHLVMQSSMDAKVLKKIKPGQIIQLLTNDNGQLEALRYKPSALQELHVQRQDNVYLSTLHVKNPEVITAFRTAAITKDEPSLYHAGKKNGLSDRMIMELASLFQWDISFALDLRQGDSFALIYEELYLEGEKVKDGEILGAYFRNMGREHIALLYEQDGVTSYYTPEGRSLRKAFIRDPVHFSHVSSSFNLRRLHPIHKKVMPHRGIDYAANRGTPVVASGDGKVSIARQNSASGKYVVIQHGEQYTTKYLHLSAFANGVRAGKSVKQGQVIGYVGATGWATAPHLHYEFLVNGVHRNPRTVKLPKAEPILAADSTRFRQKTTPMLLRLNSVVGNTSYAINESVEANGGDD